MLSATLVAATPGGKQPRNMLRTNQLDTLMLHERLALRTNTIGWLMLSPNIGAEWTLGSHNWNRWTVGGSVRGWWATNDWSVPYMVHDLLDLRLEVRRYVHGSGLRRSWFVGGYAGYADYDVKLSTTGYSGRGFTAGATAGTVAPLYGYPNGSSVDLELSLNAGLLLARQQEYERRNNQYVVTRPRSGYKVVLNPLPWAVSCDALRVALVYRFGPSVADRYRRRIDIDENFRQLQNELALKRDSTEKADEREQQRRRDSLEKADYERRFEQQRQELERRHLRDSLARVKRARYEK